VVETLGGGTPSTTEPEYWDGDITWYSPTDLTGSSSMFMFSSAKSISERGLGKSSARLFPAYSVMMTSRATIGVVAINTCEACTNQGFITCVPSSDVPLYQLYYWVRENTDKIKLLATGATFKEINKTTFRQLPIAVADATTRKAFTEMVGPIDKQVENILRKNANLRQTRDLLLPNLISGELDVADLDIATKELN
jgi:type I restriction enzyme S subunit